MNYRKDIERTSANGRSRLIESKFREAASSTKGGKRRLQRYRQFKRGEFRVSFKGLRAGHHAAACWRVNRPQGILWILFLRVSIPLPLLPNSFLFTLIVRISATFALSLPSFLSSSTVEPSRKKEKRKQWKNIRTVISRYGQMFRGSLAGVMAHSRSSFHSHNEPILTYGNHEPIFTFVRAGRSADTCGAIIRTIIPNCFSRIRKCLRNDTISFFVHEIIFLIQEVFFSFLSLSQTPFSQIYLGTWYLFMLLSRNKYARGSSAISF